MQPETHCYPDLQIVPLSLAPFATFISMLSHECMFVKIFYRATDLSTLSKVL